MSGMTVNHPVFARMYAWLGPRMDAGGMAEHRTALLAGLSGEVIEVGAGTGLNFTHYPGQVTRVVAVEPESHLRAVAQRSATTAPITVAVVGGEGGDLPVGDNTFDAAVASLVLCSVSDPARTLREIHRVLRPGGELRFLEHVRADAPGMTRVQRVLDATVWPRVAGGCHTARDTVGAIERGGFAVGHLERFSFPPTQVPLPTSPHVLGTAIVAGTA